MKHPQNKKESQLLRIEVMKLLYQYDFYQNNLTLSQTNPNPIFTFFQKIITKLKFIDEIITKSLYDYKINRLNKVDRAIIRLATYELLETNIYHAIIIDEAIELTKQFCNLNDEKQHKFNNKLLDQIYQQLQMYKKTYYLIELKNYPNNK
ncbi:transcription antitermination protein NusB [Paulownia witches'-broom phytoplasma]|uniref:Transcription antitermination protein NusB n=1 Tax=Paulownia witches'-broom phytoplasma TaxID=39647 RepID=A0ABX8TPU0_9MOLU|nr:transcription antitermination protein NusB [Paulownia witches'-broom phytoplasma]QYC31125.1 transcription antitermination protein NusB [Paulownia witches'-broom phytoplasma]GLH60338.1 transcription antitermination factor NusB [Paulownia witches'-broom phytoplasma]